MVKERQSKSVLEGEFSFGLLERRRGRSRVVSRQVSPEPWRIHRRSGRCGGGASTCDENQGQTEPYWQCRSSHSSIPESEDPRHADARTHQRTKRTRDTLQNVSTLALDELGIRSGAAGRPVGRGGPSQMPAKTNWADGRCGRAPGCSMKRGARQACWPSRNRRRPGAATRSQTAPARLRKGRRRNRSRAGNRCWTRNHRDAAATRPCKVQGGGAASTRESG